MRKIIFLIFFCFALSGCDYFLYKPDLQQGNVFSKDMVAKLRPGMTPEQVIYIMGSPILVHSFNKDRWDYVYTFRKGNDAAHEQKVTIYFDHARVKSISPITTWLAK